METRTKMKSKFLSGKNCAIIPLALFIVCGILAYNFFKLRQDMFLTVESNDDLNHKVKAYTLKIASLEQELSWAKGAASESDSTSKACKSELKQKDVAHKQCIFDLDSKNKETGNVKNELPKLKEELANMKNDYENIQTKKVQLETEISQLKSDNKDLNQQNKVIKEKLQELNKNTNANAEIIKNNLAFPQVPPVQQDNKNLKNSNANDSIEKLAENQVDEPVA